PALLLLLEALACMLLSVSYVLQLVKFAKQECPKKSGYLNVRLVTRVCLSTGARWSEAEELRATQVRDGQIQFTKTKSGKVRSVPISDELQSDLEAHYKVHGNGARIFSYAYSAFREGIGRTGIELPDGQLTHCLRHSFASHFMMNGGNILVLQRILGHASLTMTMRYAHLAPEHLQEAKHLNPLASLKAT
ncbi:tyrosine-type recombinase/integrase, partial [Janthinobacterium sp. MDT1-19]|uniref:tyrosine-type recombinase/integrase n=1 Tax=Janthinobacterium sp. MDT1-19 TaxID=1259339 RepID=UPI003F1EB17D